MSDGYWLIMLIKIKKIAHISTWTNKSFLIQKGFQNVVEDSLFSNVSTMISMICIFNS